MALYIYTIPIVEASHYVDWRNLWHCKCCSAIVSILHHWAYWHLELQFRNRNYILAILESYTFPSPRVRRTNKMLQRLRKRIHNVVFQILCMGFNPRKLFWTWKITILLVISFLLLQISKESNKGLCYK